MDVYGQAEKYPKETTLQFVISSVLAVVAVFFLLNFGSYFFPVYRQADFSMAVYLLALLGVYVFSIQYGYLTTIGKSIFYSVLFVVYYLFSFRNDPQLLEKFIQIRNVYLAWFVIVLVSVGFVLMLRTYLPRNVLIVVQSIIPTVVMSIILLIFSYALVSSLDSILHTVGF